MIVLQQGASGSGVVTLQQALKDHGFDPGSIDGQFGPGTLAAVKAFQASAGLSADGIVGQQTTKALGLADAVGVPPGPNITAKATANMVAPMFPDTPLHNIASNLPFVLQALTEFGLGDKAMVLMALGTIRAETASFEPIPEGVSRFNTSPGGHPFNLYDDRADLGNRGVPDGASFKGRGFVQLTGRFNYAKFGPLLTPPVDLVQHPDQACDPLVAARLLALFLKDNENAIREALGAGDLRQARKLVNGGSHGLADFTDAYTTGERVVPDA